MPVKLVTSDAKGFIHKIVCELSEAERKFDQNITREKLLSPNKKVQEVMSRMRLARHENNMQKLRCDTLLANEPLWRKSDEVPAIVTTGATNPSGEWNGNKIGNVKIRGRLILFKNALFDVVGLYSEEEAKIIVLKKHQKQRSEIEFLTSRVTESTARNSPREHIPERVRNEVWRRDNARCVECGSAYKLEFDHIIPIAKGGSNTARNLRILCEPCNRTKSDQIG